MINENPEEYHWAYLEFPNVPAGSYDVYVTWPKEAVNHLRGTLQMDEQLYKKIGNSGWEYVSEERVDLKNPREDAKVRERVWTKIGSVSLESKGSIAVRVWDGSVLIEDAAWIVPSGTGIEAVCGNDVCEEDEDDVSCAADCTPECGDGKEEGTESCDEGARAAPTARKPALSKQWKALYVQSAGTAVKREKKSAMREIRTERNVPRGTDRHVNSAPASVSR